MGALFTDSLCVPSQQAALVEALGGAFAALEDVSVQLACFEALERQEEKVLFSAYLVYIDNAELDM